MKNLTPAARSVGYPRQPGAGRFCSRYTPVWRVCCCSHGIASISARRYTGNVRVWWLLSEANMFIMAGCPLTQPPDQVLINYDRLFLCGSLAIFPEPLVTRWFHASPGDPPFSPGVLVAFPLARTSCCLVSGLLRHPTPNYAGHHS